jgi:NADH-quinone oxidoreductase subunit J
LTAHQIIFYFIAAAILITAFLSVTSPKVFRSAIFLLLSLLGVAGLYFWMDAAFIAAVQISVYAGGIVVLIIFSIFLTEQAGKGSRKSPAVRRIFAALAALFGIALAYIVVEKFVFAQPATGETFDPSVKKIGEAMLNFQGGGFSLPFEVVSILLLASMVGCIVVAMKSGIIADRSSIEKTENKN